MTTEARAAISLGSVEANQPYHDGTGFAMVIEENGERIIVHHAGLYRDLSPEGIRKLSGNLAALKEHFGISAYITPAFSERDGDFKTSQQSIGEVGEVSTWLVGNKTDIRRALGTLYPLSIAQKDHESLSVVQNTYLGQTNAA
ncbi:MAG: hypothetical protein ACHQHP_06025, partial [Bacteroidia bacterium]